jgi:hypothetical protein
MLKENARLSDARSNLLMEEDETVYVNVFNTKRLNIFQSIIPNCK